MMIDKQKAISIIHKKFPKKEIRTYKEYSKVYVFEVVPKGQTLSNTVYFDSTYSVDKNDGMVRLFTPSMLDEKERPKNTNLLDSFRQSFGG